MASQEQTHSIRAGGGRFVSWNGGCVLIGRAKGVVPIHAHYAIQIAFAPARGIRFRTTDAEEWTEYRGAIIPSRQPHSMNVNDVDCNAIVFVEPETREGRALTELFLQGGIAELGDALVSEHVAELFSSWREQRGAAEVTDIATRLIKAITGGMQPSVASDARILRAIAFINSHLNAPLTLEQVAAEAFLSPSRFRHLFVEETGMALRPYILWRRFVRVWDLVAEGATLSQAAHEAGFADAAHLSRTSRRMFGVAPSALTME